MHVRTRSHAGVAATGVAAIGIAAMAATPLAPAIQAQSQHAVSRDVRLAATEVPPGGLLTSFLNNQVIYCSFICGTLINIGVTAGVTTLQTPVAFVGALQSGDLLKAVGITASSVTGPTNDALAASILADTTVAVPKASNAFEVAAIGLLNVVPAAAGGLPAVGAALETAREQTFLALNSPVGGPPLATAMPNGVVQVAALSAIRVAEAIIFPAFNDVLQATVGVPNAAAQTLAATGDPVQAVAAGVNSAAGTANAAVSVVANSVIDGVKNIQNAAGQSQGSMLALTQKPSTTTTSVRTSLNSSGLSVTRPKHAKADSGSSHPLRDVASKVQQAAHSVAKTASAGGAHRSVSGKPKGK